MATTRKLLIQWESSAGSGTFAHNCSINTNREFTLEATPGESLAPDCTDPDAAAWMTRWIESLSAGVSGAGTMDPNSYASLRDLFLAAEAFNVRVKIDESGANGGGYFAMAAVMTSLAITKEGKGTISATVELQSAGEVTWVDAA